MWFKEIELYESVDVSTKIGILFPKDSLAAICNLTWEMYAYFRVPFIEAEDSYVAVIEQENLIELNGWKGHMKTLIKLTL